jgi:hypothetical protein
MLIKLLQAIIDKFFSYLSIEMDGIEFDEF